MFLPMSCTSPFTVAMTISCCVAGPFSLLASIAARVGHRLFLSRGRISPPAAGTFSFMNRSLTTFMPSISGPSITHSIRTGGLLAGSSSCSINSVCASPAVFGAAFRPAARRGRWRFRRFCCRGISPPKSSKRSVPSSRRLRMTSLNASARAAGRSS